MIDQVCLVFWIAFLVTVNLVRPAILVLALKDAHFVFLIVALDRELLKSLAQFRSDFKSLWLRGTHN